MTTTINGLAPLERRLCTLEELVLRAWPEATPETALNHIKQGKVKVNERPRRDPSYVVGPGTQLEFEADLSQDRYGLPEAASELARGPGWIIVDKPIGMPGALDRSDPMNPILFLADLCGLDRDTFSPVWQLPAQVGGPWLCALTDEEAAKARAALYHQPHAMTFMAITPRVAIPTGQFEGPQGIIYEYSATRMTPSLSELQIMVNPSKATLGDDHDPIQSILETLAAQGYPVLGDRLRGGYLVRGGMRLRLAVLHHEQLELAHSWTPERGWWIDEAIAPPVGAPATEAAPEAQASGPEVIIRPGRDQGPKAPGERDDAPVVPRSGRVLRFEVSSKTLEVLGQGHPWALDDAQTQPREGLAPGTMVQLQDPKGKLGPYALVEGPGPIAARVWGQDAEQIEQFREEIEWRVNQAFLKRAELIRDSADTNLFRLIHAEADGLPGFYLDRIGPILRATITSHVCRAFKSKIYASLIDYDPDLTILEIAHLEDVRSRKKHQEQALPKAFVAYTKHDFWRRQERFIGHEDGLRYWCEPWEGIDTGFFADQRDNRRRLVKLAAPGQRWLNLFGHTGAFSVALASRGAQVVNVDISKNYLDWTAQNFALNELDPALNVGSSDDAREYVRKHEGLVDGIIIDPPTAAQSKAGFWSIRKDYEQLIADCFSRLKPDGVMLVCRNDRKRTHGLEEMVQAAAKTAKFKIDAMTPAPPSPDYPNLAGFPEGESFEGVIVRGK